MAQFQQWLSNIEFDTLLSLLRGELASQYVQVAEEMVNALNGATDRACKFADDARVLKQAIELLENIRNGRDFFDPDKKNTFTLKSITT